MAVRVSCSGDLAADASTQRVASFIDDQEGRFIISLPEIPIRWMEGGLRRSPGSLPFHIHARDERMGFPAISVRMKAIIDVHKEGR